ncbi:MAG: peptidylprolyl isomerase [Pseudomonadota bacterium]
MSEQQNNNMIFGIIGALVFAALIVGAIIYTNNKSGSDESAPAEMAASEGATATQANAAAGQDPTTPPPNSIEVEPGNPVVATVDGNDITRVDVYRFIQTMPANVQQLPAAAVYPMAMEQVINTRIVQNKAQEANIEESEAFQNELNVAKQQLARNVYLQQEVSKEITEDKLQKAYKDLVKEIPEVEERRARHILVETESKAQAVIERLNAGGDFEELAKELSTGPTGPRGGDLGYFAANEMVPEFSEKVFSMKSGETTSEPVQTQFGFHVIKLEDVRERPAPTFEQVRGNLEAELRREILADLLQEWREDTKIVQFDINGNPLKEGANALGIVPDAEGQTATN